MKLISGVILIFLLFFIFLIAGRILFSTIYYFGGIFVIGLILYCLFEVIRGASEDE